MQIASEHQKPRYFLYCKLTHKNLILLIVGILFVCFAWYVQSNPYYEIRWNLSHSLPAHFFIVAKQEMPSKGDYIAFYYYDRFSPAYKAGLKEASRVVFIKKVTGIEGDTVMHQGREIFVNGQSMGIAKPYSLKHRPLAMNSFEGVIPKGYYFVHTDHKDSYDSRYEEIGLIPSNEVRGKAYAF